MDTRNATLSILVVEDSDNLRESILDALHGAGHHVCGIDCAEAVPEQAGLTRCDLAILDLNLPGEDGLALAARLRRVQPGIGIIMFTARAEAHDRVAGYAGGADIYLTKPAMLAELEQAVCALARRLKPSPGNDRALCLDPLRRVLTCAGGQAVALTAREVSLLAAFVRAPENLLENWQIAEILGMDAEGDAKSAIELNIVRLRKKLLACGGDRPIQSVRARGYQLCMPLWLDC